jgi:hypothetical protein
MFVAEKNVGYISTEQTITVVLKGQNRTIQIKSKSHRNEVILALEKFKKSAQTKHDFAELETFLAPIRRAVIASDCRFEIDEEGKRLYLVGSKVPIPVTLANKIIDFIENALPVDALVQFWESCLKNPHYVAVDELFVFLEENFLPITDDGGFLGYKKLNFVRGQASISVPDEFEELSIVDGRVQSLTGRIVTPSVAAKYKQFVEVAQPVMVDVHSGTIEQKVGEFVRIDRIPMATEARRQECGYGLHIGAFSYSFSGDVRVLCKVMPEDVIACNKGQAKLRTCKYQIVSFVADDKEVKELLVNLNKQEQEVVNGDWDEEDDNRFAEEDTVKCIECPCDSDGVTVGRFYYVVEADGGQILIVDEEGEQEWYDECYFDIKD